MKIVTAVVNNPIFIEIQYNSIKKHVKGEYEFIVFNDAKSWADFSNFEDSTIKKQIEDICDKLKITCINIPNDNHKSVQCAARRCADSMNFMNKYMKENKDKYLIIDSDMFFINDFNVNKYDNYHASIVLQIRDGKAYPWNGLVYMVYAKIEYPQLIKWDVCPGMDVGGSNQVWLKTLSKTHPTCEELRYTNNQYTNDKIYYFKHLWSTTWDESECPNFIKPELLEFFKNDPRNMRNKFFCEIYDNTFLHYRAGGRWMKESKNLHHELTNKLKLLLS